ncbi:MAG: type I restriction enzyme HsdR N-terminal domain-containing protein [Chitinophagales bacterium]|nr:type I restriction enzyme HsdR N-terminal domain-containing protein [Chitinophagales bacterium]MDW8428345.1 type I restriction enzyme HsdR N-terminal domain-containing protein [Chitinophagales bacterium]
MGRHVGPSAPASLKIAEHLGQRWIYDPLRRKYVALTPEEWVRQHWIHFLLHELKLPRSRMAIERVISVNGLRRRFDLVIFDRGGRPILVMEFKAQNKSLSMKTLEQVCQYNMALRVRFLVITSGKKTFVFEWNDEKENYVARKMFPEVSELT